MLKRTPFIVLAGLFLLVCLATPTLFNHVNAAPPAPAAVLGEPVSMDAVAMNITPGLAEALPLKVDAAVIGPSTLEATYQATLLKLINAERVKAGVKKVASNSKLGLAATRHSTDMAAHNFFSHTGSNGTSMTDRITKAGYKFSAAGETLYAGGGSYKTPQACIQAWLNSSGHRSIILSSAYTQVGIGYKYNAKSKYGGYYTADFAKPR